MRSVLGVHWKDSYWSWNCNTLATWCEELTHWKRPWCWEGLGAGGEGDGRGWDVWMASPTQWTWVWVNSGSWWWTVRPGVLQFMGSQRVIHDWASELNWTELNWCTPMFTAALFTLAKMWKQPKGPSTDEWIMKMLHTHTYIWLLFSFWKLKICHSQQHRQT